jgi:hypothetical protein
LAFWLVIPLSVCHSDPAKREQAADKVGLYQGTTLVVPLVVGYIAG